MATRPEVKLVVDALLKRYATPSTTTRGAAPTPAPSASDWMAQVGRKKP